MEMMAGSLDYDNKLQQLEEMRSQLMREMEQKDLLIQQHQIKQLQNKAIKLLQVEQELEEPNSEKEKLQQRLHNYEQCETLREGYVDPIAERYLMKSQPHGIAIINNSEFQSSNCELKDHSGSQIDSANLLETWKYLCYDPRVFKNLTASDITKELMKIALQSHEDYDSFVCCILSHGCQDGIFGYRWESSHNEGNCYTV